MRIFAEDVHSSALDAEQFRYVLVTVQAVGDKKWNDDYIWRTGELVPLRNQRRFFHIGVSDGSELAACANPFRFPFGCDRAVVVEFRSMRDNEQRSLRRLDVGRDLVSARQQQLGYERVVPHRFAINPNLSVRSRRSRVRQLELPRNHRLSEITFADEVRDDENIVNRFIPEKKSRVAQARFLFPKSALYIGKEVAALNFTRAGPSRRARVGIHGGTVGDDEKS